MELTEKTYQQIAECIKDAISEAKNNGPICMDIDNPKDGVDWRFIGRIFVYYTDPEPDGYTEIEEIIPLWWELHTYDENGDEIINDASFDKIINLI